MSRPRSERAHNQVLEAALELFAERGIEGTSMDAVAGAASVSKATLYKHWKNKDALALEVLGRLHGIDQPPLPDSCDLSADLVSALTVRETRRHSRDRLMPHLMAYAARNPAFGRALRARIMQPSLGRLAELLRRGIREGQLPPDLDVDFTLALLFGPMMYSRMFKVMGRKAPPDMPRRVVEAFWKGCALT